MADFLRRIDGWYKKALGRDGRLWGPRSSARYQLYEQQPDGSYAPIIAVVSNTAPIPAFVPLTATGTGAINDTFPVTAPSKLTVGVTFKNAGVPTVPTTSEYLVVTLDSALGAAFDRVIARIDPSLAAVSGDVTFSFQEHFLAGDVIDVTYTGTDGLDYTVQVNLEATQ